MPGRQRLKNLFISFLNNNKVLRCQWHKLKNTELMLNRYQLSLASSAGNDFLISQLRNVNLQLINLNTFPNVK